MSDHPSPNWQARTLIGCFLQEQVKTLVKDYCQRVEAYQFHGNDPGPYGPCLERLCRYLGQLTHIEGLLFSVDTPSTPKAIADFRKTFETEPEADSEKTYP